MERIVGWAIAALALSFALVLLTVCTIMIMAACGNENAKAMFTNEHGIDGRISIYEEKQQ